MTIKFTGKIYDVGGVNPYVWIECGENFYVSFPINEDQAKMLAKHLYEEVTIEISVKGLKEGKKE